MRLNDFDLNRTKPECCCSKVYNKDAKKLILIWENKMVSKLFPFLLWFKDYNKDKLSADVIAGITVAMVLIPQSMAYAQLAGLPAY